MQYQDWIDSIEFRFERNIRLLYELLNVLHRSYTVLGLNFSYTVVSAVLQFVKDRIRCLNYLQPLTFGTFFG